ncbi:MAG: DUF2723 domain-containing protein [bacterium]
MTVRSLHRGIAVFLFIFTLIIYLSTIAQTLSFWDCGEFIACSVIMGVPHPPGSPLYLLIGHIFSLLPFGDIGWRINLISALVSALSVMLLYATIVRLIRNYRGAEETLQDALIHYGGAAVGALTFAFTHSFWFNAVEAEVYSISLFFTAIVFYLIVRWADEAEDPASDRLLLIIAYCIGLAIGVHLLNILTIPAIALVVYFRKRKFTWSSFSITVALTVVAFVVIYPGIVKWLPATLRLSAFVPVLIFLAVAWGCYYAIRKHKRFLALALISVFLMILGYSTYTTIFIRSNLNPPINENHPDDVESFLYYMNREQYGDVGIFPRRWNNDPNYASEWDFFWDYQVNYMYNRYFLWQFVGQEGDFQGAKVDFLKFGALPLIIGLFGLGYHVSKNKRQALIVFSLFFLTGYAVILYLNQDNPQPRERDYAYVGSFYAFAIWIGIGAQGLLESASRWGKKRGSLFAVGGYLAALIVIVPGIMLARNYQMHDRSGNYIAWDYSRNILETCAPDAIIFTNGDNDTFPLWYLQEVMNVRKDVRIVNLSLLNTGWYIRQLKIYAPTVPISFPDDYIEKYLESNDIMALRKRYWPKNDPNVKTVLEVATPDGGVMTWNVPATMHLPTGPGDPGDPNFLRVQDMMIIDIIRTTKWKRPIYFAVTVSGSNMIGLQEHLTMEGLAFRLNPIKGQDIDPEKLRENLLVKYQDYYRNIGNPSIHYDDNVYRLLQNYRSAFLQLATHYLAQDQTGTAIYDPSKPDQEILREFDQFSSRDQVLFILDKMDEYIPEEVIPISSDEIVMHIGRLYADLGRPEELRKRVDRIAARSNLTADQLFRSGAVYLQWIKDTLAAEKQFERVLDLDSSPEMKLEVASAYQQMRRSDKADALISEISANAMDLQLAVKVGMFYIQTRQFDKAEAVFNDLMLKYPEDGSVIGSLLMVYDRQRNYPKAVELLSNWIAAHPTDEQAKRKLEYYQNLAVSGPN